jgi:hypothetical protein
MTQRELLPIATLIGLAAGLLLPLGYGCLQKRAYKQAEPIAIKLYGDKKQPLADLEKKAWYSDMKVEKDEEPTREQLVDFIEKYENKK